MLDTKDLKNYKPLHKFKEGNDLYTLLIHNSENETIVIKNLHPVFTDGTLENVGVRNIELYLRDSRVPIYRAQCRIYNFSKKRAHA